jgi:serine protease
VYKLIKTFLAVGCMLLASCGGGGGGGGGSPQPSQIPEGDLTISGTISVPAAVIADLDTNDPNAPPNPGPDNDNPYDSRDSTETDFYSAQLLPNPGIAGGFVAISGAGSPGSETRNGDRNDFYRVSLVPGQTISLLISDYIASDPYANDLDFLLLDLDANLVDWAADLVPLESLTVEEGGEYFIVVSACVEFNFICGNGASNYILSVGQGQGEATTSLHLSSDFVVGEALVRYKESAAPVVGGDRATLSASATTLTDNPDQAGGSVQLVKFDMEASSVPLVQASSLAATNAAEVPASLATPFPIQVPVELQDKLATLLQIKKLARNENVDWVEPNYIRQAVFAPDDPLYQYQWHYPQINLPAAWDLGEQTDSLGDGVSVAVLDTGILPSHPDILLQIDLRSPGYDFVSDPYNSLDGDGPDDDPTDPGGNGFHGTHVAGTIAAETMNGTGVAGVAPHAKIVPVRVLGRYGASLDIIRGLCYAAGLSAGQDSNCPDVPVNSYPADIINMSLGGGGFSSLEQAVIDEVLAAGVIIVAAAGNSSSNRPFYPASYDGVIGVSAVTIQQQLAPYSSFGSFVDLTAPGGDTSTDINGDSWSDGVMSAGGSKSFGGTEYSYPIFQGTSMAAPHVAGVIALMRSANDSLDAFAITEMLEAGLLTQPLGELIDGPARNDDFGYGLIDAHKALTAALADGAPPELQPWLGVTPGQLNFGSSLDSLNISLRNNSGGDLSILSITSSDPSWLLAPSEDGLGSYTVQVDRTDLPEGGYSGILTIEAASNTVYIPVIMQKLDYPQTGNVGHLYIRVIDPLTGDIRETEADISNGEYIWQIDDLPPGEYQLVAFTDADNDGAVCDSGEACGSYLTVDQPILIEVNADMAGLDYQVNFGVALSDPDDTPKDIDGTP